MLAMRRRSFLRALPLLLAAPAIPKRAYSFLVSNPLAKVAFARFSSYGLIVLDYVPMPAELEAYAQYVSRRYGGQVLA